MAVVQAMNRQVEKKKSAEYCVSGISPYRRNGIKGTISTYCAILNYSELLPSRKT